VFAALFVGAALWIELGNRSAIEFKTTDYPCADSDAVPYSARCIEFMMGSRPQDGPEAAD